MYRGSLLQFNAFIFHRGIDSLPSLYLWDSFSDTVAVGTWILWLDNRYTDRGREWNMPVATHLSDLRIWKLATSGYVHPKWRCSATTDPSRELRLRLAFDLSR